MAAGSHKDESEGFTINDGEFLDSLKEIWGDDYEKFKKIILEDKSSPVAKLIICDELGKQ